MVSLVIAPVKISCSAPPTTAVVATTPSSAAFTAFIIAVVTWPAVVAGVLLPSIFVDLTATDVPLILIVTVSDAGLDCFRTHKPVGRDLF